METFRDRREAGAFLAEELSSYAGKANARVLGLPRGGVPVAFEVASRLRLPLDVFAVRKLGVPGHVELAMGAVASGRIQVTNADVISSLGIRKKVLEAAARKEQKELERREKLYRGGRPPLEVAGKVVLLVDDGIATGATMLAAIEALRRQRVQRIVVAVPTIASAALPVFEKKADEVVAVMVPEPFLAVGQWYEDFSQTEDDEVQRLLVQGRDLRAA